MRLRDILERGYFPKELPPPFLTSSFAHVITSASPLPQHFQANIKVAKPDFPLSAKPCKYSHARGGLLRRPLSLPNPVWHYLLCHEMDSHWDELQPYIGGTSLSSTAPELKPNGRAIDGAHPLANRSHLAIQTRVNKRYILMTDITSFYHSIYTHAIPWALHTKAFAKNNRGIDHLGNRLDYLIRRGQDSQTVGIPIGPDTSLVVAEIIMQACDRELLRKMPDLKGHRFIDDYEIGFINRTDAENAFHLLEKILGEYELSLNPKKTRIEKLPCYIKEPWAGPLRTFRIRCGRGQRGDLIHFFEVAFDLQRNYRNDGVLQYAIGRLKYLSIEPDHWQLFQSLLLNCVLPEPATLPHILEVMMTRVNAGAVPAMEDIEEAVNSLIIDHSSLAHSSEVAWALWACLALNIPVIQNACNAVSQCDDSVVALLALHCESKGLCATQLDKALWLSHMTQQSLYEDRWLLCYEANVKGWLPSKDQPDHVAVDPNFGFLKSAGVSFYDATKITPGDIALPIPPIPPPVPGGYGEY